MKRECPFCKKMGGEMIGIRKRGHRRKIILCSFCHTEWLEEYDKSK